MILTIVYEKILAMRLWTLHPKYLDRQGLLAVWREGLLAQAVLKGATKGYKNHPQLNRFKTQAEPLQAIAYYLYEVYEEAKRRGYKFDRSKINVEGNPKQIQTTSGQLAFEWRHLLQKLEKRSKANYDRLYKLSVIEHHPLFEIIPGDVEDWERSR